VIASMFSCNTLSDVSSSNTAANTTGISCGSLLSNMYTDYKTTGKVDILNTKTLSNTIELSTYYKSLKANQSDVEYKKAFAAGLVTGSNDLITTENALGTVDNLLKIDKLSEIGSQTTSTASSAITVAKNLAELFKTLK